MELDEEVINIELQFNNFISIENPLGKFQRHLSEIGNSKILFSAAFGQGKTTFLKLFFEENKNKYNTFHLFPINYSISENKDIFEYIKFGILLKLLERNDISFDKEKISYLKTLPEFALKNADKILAPFLRIIPFVGGDIFAIYENLQKLSNEFFVEHHKSQIDDKLKAKNFIKTFFEKEGSIYENNFFTQLIRQLLEQLKFKSNKENVLIIDDIDRIDPEHIFRILNVFAAHFDDEDHYSTPNKFGFDKVIIVCDYTNIEKIFAHKFGSSTSFSGYINKFFSNGLFRFNNITAAHGLIEHIHSLNKEGSSTFKALLTDMFLSGNLTLRELLTISKFDFHSERLHGLNKTDQEYISNIRLLTKIFNLTDLKQRIHNCLNNYDSTVFDRHLDYDYLTRDAFIELHKDEIRNSKLSFEYNNKKMILQTVNNTSVQRGTMDYIRPHNLLIMDAEGNEVKTNYEFTPYDFYSVILKIIDKYAFKIK